MQPISRRAFLAASAAVAVAACSDGGSSSDGSAAPSTPETPAPTEPPPSTSTSTTSTTTTLAVPEADLPGDPFTLGVASGDPDAESVVLWTRLAPSPLDGGGMPATDVSVLWELARDEAFTELVGSGIVDALAADGHTLHVVATPADGWHYYRFRVGAYTSPIGRTSCAPSGTPSAPVRFASASCQNYSDGFYAAHRDIAEQAPDFVLWLGDFIYEGAGPADATPDARVHLGPEPTTVEQYRDRYARYRSDPQLQAAQAACPWFVIWDDHEVENNYAGLNPQDPDDAPTFAARRAAAYLAWWENQPTRLPKPTGPDYQVYRAAQWGDLLQLTLLDGRQYRSDQACGDVTLSLDPPCAEVFEPGRTMLGEAQQQWLLDTLRSSTATWNVIANQVVLADATYNGAVLNYDQWDGYPEQRARILNSLATSQVPNVVVVTGDIHLAAVGQLRDGDRGTGTPVGVEFITTSISSEGIVSADLTPLLTSFPDLLDAELAFRGYTLHTVDGDRWVAEYRSVADSLDPASTVTAWHSFVVAEGTNTVASA